MLLGMSKSRKRRKSQVIRPQEAEELVREQADSGLSVAAFARQRGIPAHRLYEARNRLRRRSEGTSSRDFGPLDVSEAEPMAGDPVELRLPSGLSIRLARDFDEIALRRLLGVLVSC